MPPGSKRGRRVARKRNRSNPLIKPGDMLTKSIHEYFRKTVSAECSFFHRRSKLASRNGLSFLIGLLELLKKSAPALFLRKSDSYPSSERRSGGQAANGINARGPCVAWEGLRLCRIAS